MRTRGGLSTVATAFALVALAAGCGSSSDSDTGGAAGTTADVSGSISVMGIWTGAEQKSFQAVIDAFNEQYPDVTVKYNPVGDNLPTVLSTAVEGGNPPDLATVAQPGLIQGLRRRWRRRADRLRAGRRPGELRRLDRPGRHVQRRVLRPHVQGREQVDRLVQRRRVRGRRRRGTGRLGRVPRGRCHDSRRPAFPRTRSAGRTAGRSPTCSRTSTSARPARTSTTSSPSTRSRGPTSPSRTRSRRWRRSSRTTRTSPAARAARCRPTSRPRSRTCSRSSPKAAMVIEGDFVPGVVDSPLEPESGYNVSTSRRSTTRRRRGRRGDIVVMFKSSPRSGGVR